MSLIARTALAVALILAVLPPLAAFPGGATGDAPDGDHAGVVVETMNAGAYTYVRLETADGEMWAAGPVAEIAVGDHVALGAHATMTDFYSESLGRTFATIEFVNKLTVVARADGSDPKAAAMASAHGMATAAAATSVEPLARAENGSTIAELYAGKAGLAGKTVTVRGQVVKYNSNILGQNWIHIQDGSGAAGTNDLTITTDGKARVGDVVLVRGKVALDKDFGMGYRYDLLVEEATVTVE